jgi:hypothetical protein
MANTYTLIETITVPVGGASSITFSGIPSSYTDLVVQVSCRSSQSGAFADYGRITFNGSSSTFSYRDAYGNGSSASSTNGAVNTIFVYQGNAATASTFGNASIYIPNYTGSNNKSFSIDSVVENNGTTAYQTITAGLWSTTTAINSVGLAPASGTWLQYSTFSLYGVAAVGVTPTKAPKAAGGFVYTDSTYYYHLFNATGAFVPTTSLTADVLVVAGGGGGGMRNNGGGGGAGGVLAFASQSLTTTSYTVTVGAGGSSNAGGTNSQFAALTASVGGGAGGSQSGTANGGTGGSGGGAGWTGSAGSATSGQGNAGGTSNNGTYLANGGGGGKGSVGGNGNATTGLGGAGGDGVNTVTNWGALAAVFTATNYGVSGYIAGGGGGSSTNPATQGAAGSGGGTAGSSSTASSNATANTGSGAGGVSTTSLTAGNGGSGLVIVRYLA